MKRVAIILGIALAACGGPSKVNSPSAVDEAAVADGGSEAESHGGSSDAGGPDAAAPGAPISWRDVNAASCALRARMAGDPKESSQTLSTEQGPMLLHVYMFEGEGGTSAMGITCSEPKGRAKRAILGAERAIRGGRDNIVSRIHGTLVNEEDITVLGHPGRDVVVQTTRGEIYARLIYYKKHGTVTTLLAVGYDEKDARTFFDSVTGLEGRRATP